MKVRRRVVLGTFALTLVLAIIFLSLATTAGPSGPDAEDGRSARGAPTMAPRLVADPQAGAVTTDGSSGLAHLVFWVVGLVASLGVVVSGAFVRHEISVEKARMRGVRVKRALMADIKTFQRVEETTKDRRNT
jgi:hypothetical protein